MTTNNKQDLTSEQYRVLKEKGTERPFTGKYLNNKKPGVYTCVACGANLFSSEHKFDSGSGWPSFSDIIKNGNVDVEQDDSHGMIRTEVKCANCGGHLGHVFDDGPTESGKRYCVNSVALDFKPSEE